MSTRSLDQFDPGVLAALLEALEKIAPVARITNIQQLDDPRELIWASARRSVVDDIRMIINRNTDQEN